MALSGVIDFNLTAGELISRALGKIGVRGQGFSISADEQSEGIDTLNELLKTWETEGPNLWTPAEQTVTLVSGTQTYTLSPRPRLVMNARLYDATNAVEMLPLTPWDQQDWDQFIYKTNPGLPLKYLTQKLRTSTTLTFWPLPTFSSGSYSVKVGYERAFQIVQSASDEVDIPEEFMETVVMCLAMRFIEDYQLPESATTQRVTQRAISLYQQAMGFDRAGALRLQLVR